MVQAESKSSLDAEMAARLHDLDYPAEQAGVVSIPVRGPNDTKRVVGAIIACLDGDQQS
jgi:hypothetical protein